MNRYLLCYAAVAVVFGALDFVWLSLAGPNLYRPEVGALLSDKPRVAPAALFYFIYVAGVVGFVAGPSLETGDWHGALLRGAAFGLVAYAAYDLTNLATLKLWTTRVTVIDMAWGAFATATAGALAVLVTAKAAKALGWS